MQQPQRARSCKLLLISVVGTTCPQDAGATTQTLETTHSKGLGSNWTERFGLRPHQGLHLSSSARHDVALNVASWLHTRLLLKRARQRGYRNRHLGGPSRKLRSKLQGGQGRSLAEEAAAARARTSN